MIGAALDEAEVVRQERLLQAVEAARHIHCTSVGPTPQEPTRSNGLGPKKLTGVGVERGETLRLLLA
jgi:hypothetical protein